MQLNDACPMCIFDATTETPPKMSLLNSSCKLWGSEDFIVHCALSAGDRGRLMFIKQLIKVSTYPLWVASDQCW